MAFVLDASIVLDWAFPDEAHPAAEAAAKLLEDEEALVPALLWFEVRSGLLAGERRGRLTPDRTGAFLARLRALPMLVDRAPDESVLLGLARAHKLTVDDAACLELAVRRGASLATLDPQLRAAALAADVKLVGAA